MRHCASEWRVCCANLINVDELPVERDFSKLIDHGLIDQQPVRMEDHADLFAQCLEPIAHTNASSGIVRTRSLCPATIESQLRACGSSLSKKKRHAYASPSRKCASRSAPPASAWSSHNHAMTP